MQTVATLSITLLLSLSLAAGAFAQGSPIPGSSQTGNIYGGSTYSPTGSYAGNNAGTSHAPVPGESNSASLSIPTSARVQRTAAPASPANSLYHQLPISAEEARIKLEDLSNRLSVSRPDDVKDSIYALSEWLQDVADAHWRLYKAFEKSDATKLQSNKEKDIALKFSGLKNRAKLLKADLLMKQNRYPEALGPLVEIVTAEPTSQTGQDAYKRLVDMGFSEQVSGLEVAEKGINGGGAKH